MEVKELNDKLNDSGVFDSTYVEEHNEGEYKYIIFAKRNGFYAKAFRDSIEHVNIDALIEELDYSIDRYCNESS